jgi:large subunit ribosomal protein L10
VAKNTLIRLAVRGSGHESLLPALVGPTAFVFGYGDPAETARTLTDAIRVGRLPVQIKSALLEDRLLAPGDVSRIAELPGRDVLLAQVVGTMQAPIAGLVSVLSGVLGAFLGVLEARRQQLEEL